MPDHFYARSPVGSPGAMTIATYDPNPKVFDVLVNSFTITPMFETSVSNALNREYNPVTSLTGFECEFTTPDLAFALDEILYGLNVQSTAGLLNPYTPAADRIRYPNKVCLRPFRVLAFIPACSTSSSSGSSRKVFVPQFLVTKVGATTYAHAKQPERSVSGKMVFDETLGYYWQDIQINDPLASVLDRIPGAPISASTVQTAVLAWFANPTSANAALITAAIGALVPAPTPGSWEATLATAIAAWSGATTPLAQAAAASAITSLYVDRWDNVVANPDGVFV